MKDIEFAWTDWLLLVLAMVLCAILMSGCAGVPPGEGFQSCDMVAAGDYDDRLASSGLRREDVNRAVRVALDAATFTTDWRLHDQTENCRMLMGYRVYTKKQESFPYPWDAKLVVGAYTVCGLRLIVVGTPAGTHTWADSSLVHEIFHAMQGCETPPPDDADAVPNGHGNWNRDGIFNAIDWAQRQP